MPDFSAIERAYLINSPPDMADFADKAALAQDARTAIAAAGARLVEQVRASGDPGLMEEFLAEYGLSTDEGVSLMCLAEALLRVPDALTIDALIEDKIAPSDWSRHLGRSTSTLVNASTWGLLLTGKVLEPTSGLTGALKGMLKRLGEPVIRTAIARAMREMGAQFVLGENIASALQRAEKMQQKGYTYSYDMLGEAARTEADARRYQIAYAEAITALAPSCTTADTRDNPGLSVKLSALYPRYEIAQRAQVLTHLVGRVRSLAHLAKSAGIGFNIDAEEADRLTLSLEIIESVLSDPGLAGWDGFGVVVQAYAPRATHVIDWLADLSARLDRRIMVRLVKGAYWDSEVKRAQVLGLQGFPVFTDKQATDANYLACARKLLDAPRLYPQFATHNAHTIAAILHMAKGADFEFQRLHGMGERLHQIVHDQNPTRCRIYAPVGTHRDLLAYLVRRLLENGANSSFVNQIVNPEFAPADVAADPFSQAPALQPPVPAGPDLFAPQRRNSRGIDLSHRPDLDRIDSARAQFRSHDFTHESPLTGALRNVENPAQPSDVVGSIRWASPQDVAKALSRATPWSVPAEVRRKILRKAADLYEAHIGRFFTLLAREAGKTLPDAVSELREAVDFLRYYAGQTTETAPVGLFTCISPWNFPLAIFTGQIAAALAAGNGVLAKPAEQTGLIALEAAALLHRAGVPRDVLQVLPGDGPETGAALTSDRRIGGVAFTGSTETALLIRRNMAAHMAPGAPFIGETGGINAMIVDSTALPEQAVRDVLASAFQSAGQRCSALRCLYVQEDIIAGFSEMLIGAMQARRIGNPWELSTDIGPLIDRSAFTEISDYVTKAQDEGRLLAQALAPESGHFIAPALLRVGTIADIPREVFGPVLHLASYRAGDIEQVLDTINATGYGLTFGLHSRIDDRVQTVVERVHAGNIYVNRNQIGAVVGSQPFGGEGLSGTGPKAGGPAYLPRFCAPPTAPLAKPDRQMFLDPAVLQRALARMPTPRAPLSQSTLPGPTGEMNRLSTYSRAPFLCLGPGDAAAKAQKQAIEGLGGQALVANGLEAAALTTLTGFAGAVYWGKDARDFGVALAARKGPILPLVTTLPGPDILLERSLCVDTTASGGNAALIAGVSGT